MTNYKQAKNMLHSHAKYIKNVYTGDKPAIRESINVRTHELCKEFDLSEHKQELLHEYACKLHPN